MEPVLEKSFVELHSGALTILILCALVLGTLLFLVPQLVRARMRSRELLHEEHMRTLEQGLPLSLPDERSESTGRVALLVPCVSIISAATVTCFLVAYASEHIFSVGLTVWSVAGVVSLAAITGGVALMGRLAQLGAEDEKDADEIPRNVLGK